MDELRAWINRECEKRYWSWRQASIRAGITPGAISAIMNGERPGLEVCKALAHTFDVSPEYVLRMAGHLPPLQDADSDDPEIRRTVEEIVNIWRRLKDTDPDAARRLMRITIVQAEAFEAAIKAATTRAENPEIAVSK